MSKGPTTPTSSGPGVENSDSAAKTSKTTMSQRATRDAAQGSSTKPVFIDEDLANYDDDDLLDLCPVEVGNLPRAATEDATGSSSTAESSATRSKTTGSSGAAASTLSSAASGAAKEAKGSYVGIRATNFRDFMLKPELLRAITDCGFEHPSEVQQETISRAIFGSDVLCQAKSGMGKTAVFVLSTLQQIDTSMQTEPTSSIRVLVICHTRELADQIEKEYMRFSTYMPDLKIEAAFGGLRLEDDISRIHTRKPAILVATPGRMRGLIRSERISLKNVKHFVLDECDKLIDSKDMRYDIQQIFKACPHEKQVMMFSATLSEETKKICKRFMVHPVEVFVDNESKLILHGLKQYYKWIATEAKTRLLAKLLEEIEFNQVVVFVKSTSRAEMLTRVLQKFNLPVTTVHSGLPQPERLKRYNDFKNMNQRIMVSTDVLGRGIDIECINFVINYDMADSCHSYLHRVGRAGRFGTKGVTVSFISNEEDTRVLNEVQGRFEVTLEELPESIDKNLYINALEGAGTVGTFAANGLSTSATASTTAGAAPAAATSSSSSTANGAGSH